ncbi:hypothetical protein [Tenggerimyces flavus]|uniref:Uncharacterized protein n=1 Tax=Tenggerimyces flavus TaxID=1708749 RepID=A0ABV7YGH7_9ACTN|nr:hypothetical protein [Tenggerimyces flavus]MBM7786786.1 hypothetical protein [Tenggerimyces flavus]
MGSQPPFDPTISLEPEPPAPAPPTPVRKTARTVGILLTVVGLLVVGGSTLLYVTGVLGADKPDAPVQAYVEAYGQQDCDRLWNQFTDRGKQQLVRQSMPNGTAPSEANPELKESYCSERFTDQLPVQLTSTSVDESPDRVNATVRATIQLGGGGGQSATIMTTTFQVAKVAGIWKIDSLRGGDALTRG